MRGNRTVKVSSDHLEAFSSPNMQPLAVMGINIEVVSTFLTFSIIKTYVLRTLFQDYKAIHRPTAIEKFKAHTKLNSNVVLLRLFPSIRTETLAHFLEPPVSNGYCILLDIILNN